MGKRFVSGALLVSMLVAGIVTVSAGAASASTSDESHFVSLINYERTTDTRSWSCGRAGGLNSLAVYSDLVAVARKHSEQMAAKGTIWHDSSTWNSVSGWTEYGENVGMGPDNISDPVGNLHTAFMNSSEHCQNILFSHSNPPFNEVGVGVVVSNNTMYVTEIFVRRGTTSTTTYHRTTTTTTHHTTTTTTHHTTTYRPVASVTHTVQAAAKPAAKPQVVPVGSPQTVDLLVRMIGMDSDNVDPATGAAAGF